MALDQKLAKARLEAAGYVEHPGGPLCGNCFFNKQGSMCGHPKIMAQVDLVNGCCDLWEPRSGGDEQ